MKISKEGIDFIKSFESFKPKMYYCQAGKPTIGYGTVIDTESEKYLLTATIAEEKASQLMAIDLGRFERSVNSLVKVKLTQHQFDMLVSFAYNAGAGDDGLAGSTLLKKVNINPNDPTIKAEFNRWVYAGGKKSNGLIRRRKDEGEIYFL
jgi:lysozyme